MTFLGEEGEDWPFPKSGSSTEIQKEAPICPECNEEFTSLTAMKNHRITKHNYRQFECPECGKRFKRSAHMRCHLNLHTGMKSYQCYFCGRLFTDPSNHRKHMKLCKASK